MKDDLSTELYRLENDFAIYSVRELTKGTKHSMVSEECVVEGDVFVRIKFNGVNAHTYTLNDLEEILYENNMTEVHSSEELDSNNDYRCTFCTEKAPPPSVHQIVKNKSVAHEDCINKLFDDLEQLIDESSEKLTAELL